MATVIAVIDGDTLDLDTGYRIRLDEIDAPESSQAYGKEAKCYLESLCLGQAVILTPSGMDDFGRILGHIEVIATGLDVNTEMVQAGWAWHYKQFSDNANLAALETAARQARMGLWNTIKATTPWVFRRSDW